MPQYSMTRCTTLPGRKRSDSGEDVKMSEKKKIQALHSTVLEPDNLCSYHEEFELVFNDDKITNIALSGPYGAGKSTVVDSWERNASVEGSNNPWIHISLADFDRGNEENSSGRNIDAELINQLVHKLGNRKAPKSRFSIARDNPLAVDILISLFISLCIVLTLTMGIILQGTSVPLVPSDYQWIIVLAWLICLVIVVFQFYRRRLFGRALKRLKFLNAEVETLDSDSSNDLFDKHLDDIVYLFCNACSDVIVFEDLDRFNDVSVFEKLRRVNELANVRRSERRSSKGTTLRFIYLVRDSLFNDPKDRTKFFDLIIPVIPFVDPSNAFDVLKQGFQDTDISPTSEFLYQLSLYIDDPRILKDICNESQHYKSELFAKNSQDNEQFGCWNDDRLVAMIAYKVLFPADYELLQVGDGYVFSRFEKKGKLIDALVRETRGQISQLEQDLDDISRFGEMSKAELSLIYLMLDHRWRHQLFNSNNQDYSTVEEMLSKNGLLNQSNQTIASAIQALSDEQIGNVEYKARVSETLEPFERESTKIRSRIAALKDDILDYERRSLADLLSEHEDSGSFFQQGFDDDSPYAHLVYSRYFSVLRFLLAQGYINEDYQLYMSKRYHEALSAGDEAFLFSLLGGHATSQSGRIDEPGAVVLRLSKESLARRSARNWNIFTYLASQGDSEKLETFVRAIKRDHDSEFICSYILSEQFDEMAYKALENDYPTFLNDLITDGQIKIDDKRTVCHKVMSSEGATNLVNNAEERMLDFASHDQRFLALENDIAASQIDQMKSSLDAIGFCAERIDFVDADSQLLSFVAANGLFEPNFHNVLGLARHLSGDSLSAAGLNNWLSRTDGTPAYPIKERMLEKKEVYIRSISDVAPDDFKFDDDDEAIAMMLNNPTLDSNELETYIGMLSSPIGSLALVESADARRELLKQGKCAESADNIAEYLSGLEFDEVFAKWFAGIEVPAELTSSFLEMCGLNSSQFILSCAQLDSLDDACFTRLARQFESTIIDALPSGLKLNRVETLVNLNSVPMNKENLDIIRNDYPGLAVRFISKDVTSYVSLVTPKRSASCRFSSEEVLRLFEADLHFDDELLAELVECLDLEDTSLSPDYSDEVNLALLRVGAQDPYSEFPEVYDSAGETLGQEIVERIAERVADYEDTAMSKKLEVAIVKHLSSSQDAAKRFIASRIRCAGDNQYRETARELFLVAGLGDYVGLLDGSMRSFEMSAADQELIQALRDAGMCGKSGRETAGGKTLVYPKNYKRSN